MTTAANADRTTHEDPHCPECDQPADNVWHDTDEFDRQLCADCCPTCQDNRP